MSKSRWWKVAFQFDGKAPRSITFTASTVGGAMRKFLDGLDRDDRAHVSAIHITEIN